MSGNPIVIGGIVIPFDSPVLLFILGIHVLAGLVCVASGIAAMFSRKGPGRHTVFGRIYFWGFAVVFVTTTVLSIARRHEDFYLFIIGTIAFASAAFGRNAVKSRHKGWTAFHIIGMGMSFILLLTAFYLDNGKNLPVWKDMPHFMFWFLPNLIGIPLIIFAMVKYRNY